MGMEPTVPNRSADDWRFTDRTEAGALLADRLRSHLFIDPLILALPRGGVPVAYEVAHKLEIPMEVLVARKIGAPGYPEYAVGAIVEGDFSHLNARAIEALRLSAEDVERVLLEEREELRRRVAEYRLDRPLPRIKGRDIVLVDDGIATGETARVAVRLLRDRGARKVIVAAPVGPARLDRRVDFPEADELILLRRPQNFRAVGQFYSRFGAVSDEAVIHLAERGRQFGAR